MLFTLGDNFISISCELLLFSCAWLQLACSTSPGYKVPYCNIIVMQYFEVYHGLCTILTLLICSIVDTREEEKMGKCTILTLLICSIVDTREEEKMGKGLRSRSRIGRLYNRKGDLQKRKKDDAEDNEVDEINEDEISGEVPKDLEDIVEEIVADLETVSTDTK